MPDEQDRQQEWEQALQRALREPVELPPNFSSKVIAAARGQRPAALAWRRALAAVLLVAISLGSYAVWHTRRVREARRAVAGFALAMEIAHTALADSASDAQSQVRGAVETMNQSHTGKAEQ